MTGPPMPYPLTPIPLVAATTAAPAVPCPHGTLTGAVRHGREGDMIAVGAMPIRLSGLATPEWIRWRNKTLFRISQNATRGSPRSF